MKGFVAAISSAFLVTSSGCGGGGDSVATTSSAQQPPASKSILIEVYGDSTAQGCTATPDTPAGGPCIVAGYALANSTAPQELQTLLQAKYGPTVTVMNHGIVGTTAARLLAGDGVNLPWAQQMAQSKATIVTFNFGINDSKTAANEPVNIFLDNEAELIRIAKAAGKIVVLETANPVTDPSCAALPSYVAASIAAASLWGIPVIDQYAYLSAQSGWNSMLSDTEHPTAAGYKLKADFAFIVMERLVGAALSR